MLIQGKIFISLLLLGTVAASEEGGDRQLYGGGNGYVTFRASTTSSNKCKQAERDACCNQLDSQSYARKVTICKEMGCNFKKCGSRDGDNPSDNDSEWKAPPTTSPVWGGDEWGAPPTRSPVWNGDGYKLVQEASNDEGVKSWRVSSGTVSGSDGGDDLIGDGFNKCKSVERDACCNQRDRRSYERKAFICEKLGCNIKKCGKRNGDQESN